MTDYKEKYNNYRVRINWNSSEPFDPKNETVEIRLTAKDGQEYISDFTTRKFIDYMFEKNKRTGECGRGTYFCMPRMIILEEINEQNIRTTIDDLITNMDIENYFKKMD